LNVQRPGWRLRDRDLYVFCANAADGIETAHPTHRGSNLNEVKDADGFAFGQAILEAAEPGEIKEVAYMWPRPGSETPEKKITYVTKVDDQVCAVGYYP
jgi:signal transduction histidine kinase